MREPRSRAILETLEDRRLLSAAPMQLPQGGFTPALISSIYGFDQVGFTSKGKAVANGAGQTIAIISAYNAPNIGKDLRTFDKAFGLPNKAVHGGFALTIAKPQGKPATNASWAQETSLDVEWAHAMAPGAKILLVEARTDSPADLAKAVDFARHKRGVSVVSMSFGYDSQPANAADFIAAFTTPANHVAGLSRGDGVSFVMAGGDDGSQTAWPDTSVPVVSVGGTVLAVDANGAYAGETVLPQDAVSATVGYAAAGADSGFDIYDSTPFNGKTGWQTVQGTSASTPQWAAILAIANQGRGTFGKHSLDGPTQTLPYLVSLPDSDFHVIPGGGATTGRGSPMANLVIADLVGLP